MSITCTQYGIGRITLSKVQSTGYVLKAKQLTLLVVFGAADGPLPSSMTVHF